MNERTKQRLGLLLRNTSIRLSIFVLFTFIIFTMVSLFSGSGWGKMTVYAEEPDNTTMVNEDSENLNENPDNTLTVAESSDKILTVDSSAPVVEGESYQDIQSSINYIRAQGPNETAARQITDGPEDGWTILVKGGTYDAFVVIRGVDNCTIQTAENAVIKVYDGHEVIQEPIYTSDGTAFHWYRYVNFGQIDGKSICQYVQVDSNNLTIDGFTFEGGGNFTPGSNHNPMISNQFANEGNMMNGLLVKNCIFNGGKNGIENHLVGIKIETGASQAMVENCIFNNLHSAIYFEDYALDPIHYTFRNNTFTDCNMAIHGSWDNNFENSGTLAGNVTITGNTVIGTEELRNKIVIQDTPDLGSTILTINGNKLENALIGLISLDIDTDNLDDYTGDVYLDNTFGENSFYVRANETNASIDNYVAYEAPKDKIGHWYLRDGDGDTNP